MAHGSDFVIVSPDTLHGVDTYWTLCFIFQQNNNDNLINIFGKIDKCFLS